MSSPAPLAEAVEGSRSQALLLYLVSARPRGLSHEDWPSYDYARDVARRCRI